MPARPRKPMSWLTVIAICFGALVLLRALSPTKHRERQRSIEPTATRRSAQPLRPAECDYLKSDGMPTGQWGPERGATLSDFGCISTYYDIDGGPSNIAYYVSGSPSSVNILKLVLNVNEPSQARPAYKVMGERSGALLGRLMGDRVRRGLARSAEVENAILPVARAVDRGQAGRWVLGGIPVELQIEKFPKKGHSVTLTARF